MSRALKSLVASTVLAAAGTTGALAQNISNETWLGQVGGMNTITINQSGRNNQAGASNTALRLNQDGNDNVLMIDQFGHRNQVGASPLAAPPTGINQVGGGNVIDVEQRTAQNAVDGTNVIGAIFQLSSYVLLESANILTIVQNEAGGDGKAGHGVGTVRQVFTGADSDSPNEAKITQTGGGSGEGNLLSVLHQVGIGNIFNLLQQDQSNAVIDVRQFGRGNSGSVTQLGGDGNRVEYLQQWGYGNKAEVSMEGRRNVVERIFQFNTHLGPNADGNLASVTLHGEDNGGASGLPGEFSLSPSAALDVSVPQANVVQIGAGNRASITISGDDNKFGTQQFGDGNGAIVAIGVIDGATANANESAIFQRGDDNQVSHKTMGDLNVAAVQQFGDDNWLDIEQTSQSKLTGLDRGNLAEVSIVGHRNNNFGAAAFSGLADSVLPSTDFGPGKLFQDGLNNTIRVNVVGSDNSFGLYQNGNGNFAESIIFGASNQVVVVQLGNNNVSVTQQYGSENIAVILQ